MNIKDGAIELIQKLEADKRKLLNRAETAEMDAQIAEQAIVTLDAELNEVKVERDALKTALIFYGDGIMTFHLETGPLYEAPDDGTVAREALEKVGAQ